MILIKREWDDNIKMDLKKQDGVCGLDLPDVGYEPVAGSCEHVNEFLVL
jgi:hypothetical protein